MSEIASFDRGKTESALWARAEEAHRRGHLEAALSGYATLARGRLVAGESLPPYLLDRLAAACAEIGELGPAALVLEAAREQALTAGDDYGAARMSLRLAKVALEAGDVARAGEHLRRALGLTVEGDDPSEILGRITALAWADHGPSDAAMGRVDAALTAARLWSTQGRYLPAIRATELALRLLPGAEAFFDRGGIKLSLAELHLETGDLKKARSIESSARPAHENDTSEAAGEARWRLFSARRACLEGRLSEARHALTREAEDSRAPFTRLDFQAAWMLAGLLGRMNRIHEAEEILARARARCGPSPAHARFRQRLNDLSGRLREKRDGVSRVMELPFVPEQAFESAEAPAQERASTSEPGGAARTARRGRRSAVRRLDGRGQSDARGAGERGCRRGHGSARCAARPGRSNRRGPYSHKDTLLRSARAPSWRRPPPGPGRARRVRRRGPGRRARAGRAGVPGATRRGDGRARLVPRLPGARHGGETPIRPHGWRAGRGRSGVPFVEPLVASGPLRGGERRGNGARAIAFSLAARGGLS